MWPNPNDPRDPGEQTMNEEDINRTMDSVLRTHRLVLARVMERIARAIILCEDRQTFRDCIAAAREALTLLSDALTTYRPRSSTSAEQSTPSSPKPDSPPEEELIRSARTAADSFCPTPVAALNADAED